MQNMETRYTHSPEDIRHYSTEQLRKEFLVEKVFVPGAISLTYTHNDRMIFGGVTPTDKALEIVLDKELGVDYFLERREMGVINIGGPGYHRDRRQKRRNEKTRRLLHRQRDAPSRLHFRRCSKSGQILHQLRAGAPQTSERENQHRQHQTDGNRRTVDAEPTQNLPIHPSERLRKLPTADGLHDFGAGQRLEHDADPHARTQNGSLRLFRYGKRHTHFPHDGQTG